jgi:hypothetical protein
MISPIDISMFVLRTAPVFYYIATFIGLATVLTYVFTVLHGVFKIFRKRINLKERYGANAWALVTGSSEGSFGLM